MLGCNGLNHHPGVSVQVPATLLLIKLPAHPPGKAWASATCVASQDGVAGCQLWPDSGLDFTAPGEWNPWIEDESHVLPFPPSSGSAFQISKGFGRKETASLCY